jgi:pimeloyl-ACP methyl ester carboxylesterase
MRRSCYCRTATRAHSTSSAILCPRLPTAWFPKYQAYLREYRPPTLIVWGPQDGYMPEGSARAYLRDLPDAELHLLDGGHWAWRQTSMRLWR